jgi:hypothetical protein
MSYFYGQYELYILILALVRSLCAARTEDRSWNPSSNPSKEAVHKPRHQGQGTLKVVLMKRETVDYSLSSSLDLLYHIYPISLDYSLLSE